MKKILFIFFCLIFLYLTLFPFTSNFIHRFFIDGILFYVIGIILLRNNPLKRIGAILIFAPFLLLHSIFAIINIYNNIFPTLPILIITIVSCWLALLLFKKSIKKIIIVGLIYLSIISTITYYLPNYFHFIWDYKNEELYDKTISDLNLYESNGRKINLRQLKGKILVIDIWTSSCGVCIREFPKFERLKNEFKTDSTIQFINLNIPIRGDKRERVTKFTNKFSFKKLYADNTVATKLNIKAFPQYLVINKKSQIKYMGSLNIKKEEIYNNFYSIIKQLKNEK